MAYMANMTDRADNTDIAIMADMTEMVIWHVLQKPLSILLLGSSAVEQRQNLLNNQEGCWRDE